MRVPESEDEEKYLKRICWRHSC